MRARCRLLAISLLLAACGGDSTGPVPVASVSVQAPSQEVDVGSTLQLTATVRDASGAELTNRTVTWTSSEESVAEVSPTGLVTGISAGGPVTITATVEGQLGTTAITVVSTIGPRVTGISPAALQEGQTATITGGNFSTTPQNNIVRIAGARATVGAATSTTLEITVPAACIPTGAVDVTVEVGGHVSAAVQHEMNAPASPALAVGEQVIIRQPNDLCFRLAANGAHESYLVGLQSTSEVASTVTRVRLNGLPATAAAAAAAAAAQTSLQDLVRSSGVGGFGLPVIETDPVKRRWRTHRRAERELRHIERRAIDPRRARTPRPSELRTSATAMRMRRDVQVGDTLRLNVPNRASDNFCEQFTAVRAVARAIGERGIWLDDVANPEGFTTAHFEDLSREFDEKIYATNVEYFGEPTDIDGNGRILILITQSINRYNAENPERAALGFVTAADLLPREDPPAGCPFSNEAEIYYGVAPDPQGALGWTPGGEPYTVADARADASLLIAHEFTHIIQLGRRLADPTATTFQSVWELEGQATLAEEVVGHAMTGRSPRQNYGARVALNHDEHPVDWYFSGIVGLALYYGFESREDRVSGAPEQCTWLTGEDNGPCTASASLIYGVPWSLLRWISDHYGPEFAGGEQELHRRLVNNGTLQGFQNLVNVTGTPIPQVLAEWAAMLYVDGRVAQPANERLRMLSWDMYDIFERGLVPTARLQPRSESFAAFSTEVAVRAGSTAYFQLEGSNRPAIGIRGTDTNNERPPTQLQMWVVRLQ
jgi:hypothetical protein